MSALLHIAFLFLQQRSHPERDALSAYLTYTSRHHRKPPPKQGRVFERPHQHLVGTAQARANGVVKEMGSHHHTLGDLFESLHRNRSDATVSETLVQVPLGAF